MPLIFSRAPDLEKEEDYVATEFAPHGIDTLETLDLERTEERTVWAERPPSDMERNKEYASNKSEKQAGWVE